MFVCECMCVCVCVCVCVLCIFKNISYNYKPCVYINRHLMSL